MLEADNDFHLGYRNVRQCNRKQSFSGWLWRLHAENMSFIAINLFIFFLEKKKELTTEKWVIPRKTSLPTIWGLKIFFRVNAD